MRTLAVADRGRTDAAPSTGSGNSTGQASRLLHLGCGTTVVDGWINIDGSWSVLASRIPLVKTLRRLLSPNRAVVDWPPGIVFHDVRKGLPFSDASMQGIYSSHMLEHLHLDEAQRLLRDCHRVLEPGGVLRVVVPDLRTILLDYASDLHGRGEHDRPLTADLVNQRLNFRRRVAKQGSLAYRLYSAMNDFHTHKWMYDADSLAERFREAGFVDVAERWLHESRIPGIEEIEHADRVENGAGICIEGIRPEGSSA